MAAEKQELETQLRQEISAREAAIATLESDKAIYAAEKETSRVYLETREKRMAQLLVDNVSFFSFSPTSLLIYEYRNE